MLLSRHTRRRDLLRGVGFAVAWPFAARAQQRVASIGVLHGVSAAQWKDRMVGLNRGLGEWGFSEGHNLSIELGMCLATLTKRLRLPRARGARRLQRSKCAVHHMHSRLPRPNVRLERSASRVAAGHR